MPPNAMEKTIAMHSIMLSVFHYPFVFILSSFPKHFHAIILLMQKTAAKDKTPDFLSQRQGAGVPAARFSSPIQHTAAENAYRSPITL